MQNQLESQNIKLRAVNTDDGDFLCAVYASARRAEVAMFGWDFAQENAFLQMQFATQTRSYRMQFPNAENSLILLAGNQVGRMIADRTEKHILLVDIAVLPEFRGKGIGTYLIRNLQTEAANADKPLLLDVEKTNFQAKKLYENLGFAANGETDLHYQMKWENNCE